MGARSFYVVPLHTNALEEKAMGVGEDHVKGELGDRVGEKQLYK